MVAAMMTGFFVWFVAIVTITWRVLETRRA